MRTFIITSIASILLFACSSTNDGPGTPVPTVDAGDTNDVGSSSTDITSSDTNILEDTQTEPSDALNEDLVADVSETINVSDQGISDLPTSNDQGSPVMDSGSDGSTPPQDMPIDSGEPAFGESAWFKSFGGTNSEEIKGVTADSQGNVYVTGIFQSEITIGPETFPHSQPGASTQDFFVASYAPDGSFRWARAYGTEGNDNTFEIAVDNQDRVYVAGFHHNELTVGTQVLSPKGTTDADIFVLSFDAEGNLLWAKNWGGPYGEAPRDLSVNSAGDIFITGSYQGSMTADSFTVDTNVEFGGVSEIFVLAVDSESHEAIWLTSFSGIGHDVGTSIEADNTRNVVLGISYQYDIDLSEDLSFDTGGTNFSVGLVRLDHTGALAWAKSFGGSGNEEIIGLDLDVLGNAYLTGVFSDIANFGGEDLTGIEGHDVMLAAYSPNGDHMWSVGFGGTSFDQALDLEVMGNGVYITGRFNNDLAFGDMLLNSPDSYNVFLGHFSTTDGSPVWVNSIGGVENDQANGIGLGGDGSIYVGGYHKGPLSLDGSIIEPASENNDCFILRFTE